MNIDIRCISETRIQDSSVVIELKAPEINGKYFLRTSGDEEARVAGHYGVGVVLNSKSEAALLDWIPVNSRLCAVRLRGEVKINKHSLKNDACS